eukprot:Gb_27717 [translate_table: standard]
MAFANNPNFCFSASMALDKLPKCVLLVEFEWEFVAFCKLLHNFSLNPAMGSAPRTLPRGVGPWTPVLLKEGCDNDSAIQKVKFLNQYQKMVPARKIEEAAIVTYRLKELLESQEPPPNEFSDASLSNGSVSQNTDQAIKNWLDRELEIAAGIYQVRTAHEKQTDSQAALAKELGKLKDDDLVQRFSLSPQGFYQNKSPTSVTNQISSESSSMQILQLHCLENMLDNSSSALVDMASQLSDAEEQRAFNSSERWQHVRTLGEAKNLLRLTFGAATVARS